MPLRTIGMLLALLLLAAGCGDRNPVADDGHGQFASPSTCASTVAGAAEVARVDLDGDGTADPIHAVPATGRCGPLLSAVVGGRQDTVALGEGLPVRAAGSFAISVPGRAGQVVMVLEQHPRGGFQAHLFGYAGGKLEELQVDGKPIFPFVATDTLSTPLAATCTEGGFEVTTAQAHQPIGVVPAWDIQRTTYELDGNAVTTNAITVVADNVLDGQLRRKYADLVHHRLFENCRAGS